MGKHFTDKHLMGKQHIGAQCLIRNRCMPLR